MNEFPAYILTGVLFLAAVAAGYFLTRYMK
jgi:hypothetical protein